MTFNPIFLILGIVLAGTPVPGVPAYPNELPRFKPHPTAKWHKFFLADGWQGD